MSETPPRALPAYPSLLVLLGVYFLLRCVLAHSPFFAETYYDEAVTGNMALHVLKGEHQLFFWGQPYMGALEAYLASSLFLLFGPSAFVLHLTDILICSVLFFLAYRFGEMIAGRSVGLIAAGLWAFSSLYLSVIGLLATGGHEEACALGVFALFGICRLCFRPSKDALPLALLIGLAGGLGFWSSLLSAPYLLIGALGLAAVRPRLLLTRLPWVGIAGFLAGSLPFWLWEMRHDFSTFTFFQGQGMGIFNQLLYRIYYVLRYSLFQSFLGDWWDGHSVLEAVPAVLAWLIWIVFYLPPFILSLLIIFRWVRRVLSRSNPIQGPLDLMVALFWVLVLAFSTSEQGASGSLRYTLTFYTPFLILTAVWLNKIRDFNRWLGSGLLVGLLAFNLSLHVLFLQEHGGETFRPIDGLIRSLQAQRIRFAYADNRISQPLTFESREQIICTDYYGQRNYDYLRAVDRAPAEEVAIITHRELGNPSPEVMASSLDQLGGSFRRYELGNYVVWHHFQQPATPLRSLPGAEWRITASQKSLEAVRVKDRNILSYWEVPEKPGEWLLVDLGRVRNLGGVSLLPGPGDSMGTARLRIEISPDGKAWQAVNRDQIFLTGLSWFQGHPRFDENPRLQFIFPAYAGRYLRLTNLNQPDNPRKSWGVAELFVYEALAEPVPPAAKAEEALAQARRLLDHWRDDPTGPHPFFPNTDMTFRRKQVRWAEAVRQAQRAINLAPDWEEAYQVLGKAFSLGELPKQEGEPLPAKELHLSGRITPEEARRLPAASFQVSANFNSPETGAAIDGDPGTRWTTGRPQVPGMFFQIDLGAERPVKGFSLFLNRSLRDVPRELKILASLDQTSWQEVRSNPLTEYYLIPQGLLKYQTYYFEPVNLRYLKLLQTGSDPLYWWSIYEMEIHAVPETKNKSSSLLLLDNKNLLD